MVELSDAHYVFHARIISVAIRDKSICIERAADIVSVYRN